MLSSVLAFSRLLQSGWRKRQYETAVILGNGPSLKEDLGQLEAIVNETAVELWAVNNFCFSEEFTLLRPSLYVLADPNYWAAEVNDEVDTIRRKFVDELRNRLDWPMTLLLPLAAKDSKVLGLLTNPLLDVKFYNSTPVGGSLRVSYWLMRHQLAMPAAFNVLISAVSLALCASYKKIFILGADHSWHEQLTVTNSGEALVAQHHFYQEKVEARPIFRPAQSNFTVGDMFLRWGEVFKRYELLQAYARSKGVCVINASSKSYIDAFQREKLSTLRQ